MKKIVVTFEQDPNPDRIDVLIRASERDREVEVLMERISNPAPDTILASDADGALQRINVREIVSVSVSGKQAEIITENERYTVRQPLQSFEDVLESRRFVRISRYEIINLDKVSKFDFTLSGTLRIEFAGGMETWASRRNIPLIRKKLTEGSGK
ncbi:MAG: LytTR family transcriptional regulator DNA-binding domain-containing protein [Lachnospiraceae bacterium]|nr:LytTR family transcriptional regulator DNA-binding domain-containing protein [Lachnospiraceae bacterium]